MKIITTGLASVLLAAGVAGSVAAYRSQAVPDASVPSVRATSSAETAEPARTATPEPRRRVRWAPCPHGSKLEKGVCVTDVVRTVVVPAPAAPAPAPAPQPAAPVLAAPGSGGQDGDDDGGQPGGPQPGAEPGDDDGQDDVGDDDGGQDDGSDDGGHEDGDDGGDDGGHDDEDDGHDD